MMKLRMLHGLFAMSMLFGLIDHAEAQQSTNSEFSASEFDGCYFNPVQHLGPVARGQVAFRGKALLDELDDLVQPNERGEADRLGSMAIHCTDEGQLLLEIFNPESLRLVSRFALDNFVNAPASLTEIHAINYSASCEDANAPNCLTHLERLLFNENYRFHSVGMVRPSDGAIEPRILWVALRDIRDQFEPDGRYAAMNTRASNVYYVGFTELRTGSTSVLMMGVDFADGAGVPF